MRKNQSALTRHLLGFSFSISLGLLAISSPALAVPKSVLDSPTTVTETETTPVEPTTQVVEVEVTLVKPELVSTVAPKPEQQKANFSNGGNNDWPILRFQNKRKIDVTNAFATGLKSKNVTAPRCQNLLQLFRSKQEGQHCQIF
jgi:hypothetical protein